MKFIIFVINDLLGGSFHVKTNWQDARQREVRILNVLAINLLIPVEKIRVLELLNRFMSNFGHPVIDTQAAIFKNNLLEIIKFIPIVVIGLKILDKLSQVSL
jgi:hypothetical protein